MREIAERSGVSRATVSYVLNQRHEEIGICEDTRQRILAVASDMGYRRNELARAITTGKNPVLGFLGGMSDTEHGGYMLSGASDEAERLGYALKLFGHPSPEPGEGLMLVRRCVEWRLAGIVAFHLSQQVLNEIREEIEAHSLPVVILDSNAPQKHIPRVLSDDVHGMGSAVDYLVSLGHRRIGLMGGPRDSGTAELRRLGYEQAMHRHGLSTEKLTRFVRGPIWDDVPTVEQHTRELLGRLDHRPTALLCVNDPTAMIVCRTLRRMGLRVPEDVSVVGYANLHLSGHTDPPLTTVAQPFVEMGKTSVRLLLQSIQAQERKQTLSQQDQLLATKLVIRESCAPPAQ